MGKLKDITKELIHELYVIQNKTDKEIGVLYGATDVAVRRRRINLGIPTKSQLSRLSAGKVHEFDQITPAQLAEMYSSMGQRVIAKQYGVAKPTVANKLKKFGIQAISKSDRSTSYQDLSEEQKDVCIGILLGDGHILERGALKITHYYGQIGYLLHIHRILFPLILPISYEEKEMDNGQLTFGFILRTVQHTWFQSLRFIFYPDGEKIYPISILQSLSPRSLAYWYFDDGTLDSGLPSFCVGKLTDAQFFSLITELKKRFSFDLYEKATSKNDNRLLGIRARSADAFFTLIKEFVTPDLLYKFPPKHWAKGIFPRLPTKTEVNLLPKHLSDKAKQWSSLDEDSKAVLVEMFTDYWTTTGFPYHVPRPEELEVLLRIEPQHVIQDGKIKIRQVGQSICQGLCPSIWSAFSYGSKKSPIELFSDRNSLREVIQFCFKMGEIPNQARMRAALRYWRRNGVYNFRPSAAKTLVDRYCRREGVVLDPCAGYGGRLLGTLTSSSKAKYIGYEPATDTFVGLNKLHAWVCQYLPEFKDRVILKQEPAEEAIFPECDMVLTSPPYWKREVYSLENTQSAIRFPTYELWLNGFWSKVISNCINSLRPSGWLILNVDDFSLGGKDYHLINDTIRIVNSLGLASPETLVYLMPSNNNTELQTESVLCWTKGQRLIQSFSEFQKSEVEFPRCSVCGKTKRLEELIEGECLGCRASSLKTCLGCGIDFRIKRRDQQFHNEACYARYKRKLHRQEHPVSGVRTFTCVKCNNTWQTSALGSFTLCPSCREAKEIEIRKKVCSYRYCGQSFVDTSLKNGMKFCCPEHRRREKLFRSGLVKDLSYFQDNQPKSDPLCVTCGKRWKRSPDDKAVRCLECREKARHKICHKCGQQFVDSTKKNTKRFCDACLSRPISSSVSDRLEERRRGRVHKGEGGRIDRFKTLRPFSETWWGKVGELLFLHLYPDATDATVEYGNMVSFDAQHRTLGRVSVKTAKAKIAYSSWAFQLTPGSDSTFLVGFSEDRTYVERVWLIPSNKLPNRLKVLTPNSREYTEKVYELGLTEIQLIDRKFQTLLLEAKNWKEGFRSTEEPRVEYERTTLGNIGEAIYSRLYPDSIHVSKDDPLAPWDFVDSDGITVNVRLRRKNRIRNRWTFFRSSIQHPDLKAYFFIGLDWNAKNVEVFFRVPSSEMPAHGFSVGLNPSKWDVWKVKADLPKSVSSFVSITNLEEAHLKITSVTPASILTSSSFELESLLNTAFTYHRILGFPYPAISSDKRLRSWVEIIQKYTIVDKELPIENAGLGFCSAYMPHRFKAKNADADFTAFDAFWNDDRLMRALRFCVSGRVPNLKRPALRSALTSLNRTPMQFRPAVAKVLVDSYAPLNGLVLDPCAGWGGRFFGTLLAKRRYAGVEPIKLTVDALWRMGSRLCEFLVMDRANFQLFTSTIQAMPDNFVTADMAITSPPYWTKEIYERDSIDISLDQWINNFLDPMFKKVKTCLTRKAAFVVNVSNIKIRDKVIPLENITIDVAAKNNMFLEDTLHMIKSAFGNQPEKRFEPIFIFRQNSSCEEKEK